MRIKAKSFKEWGIKLPEGTMTIHDFCNVYQVHPDKIEELRMSGDLQEDIHYTQGMNGAVEIPALYPEKVLEVLERKGIKTVKVETKSLKRMRVTKKESITGTFKIIPNTSGNTDEDWVIPCGSIATARELSDKINDVTDFYADVEDTYVVLNGLTTFSDQSTLEELTKQLRQLGINIE